MPTTVPAAREKENKREIQNKSDIKQKSPALGFTTELSMLRVSQGGGQRKQSRSQQELSRSGFCSGGRGGQDVVALPSDILQQPK